MTTPAARAGGAGTVAAAVISAVAAVPVVGYTMLGPMACDSCTGATLATFNQRYTTALVSVLLCLVLAMVLLVGGWLASRGGHRTIAIVMTWLAPVVVAVAALLAVLLIRP
jgi:hypothetical protein